MASFRCVYCDEIKDDADGFEKFTSRTTGKTYWGSWICQSCIDERDGPADLAEDIVDPEPWT